MNRHFLFVFLLTSCSADSSRTIDPEPTPAVRTCGVQLSYSGAATDVSVSGEFNDWGETTLRNKDGVWTANVEAPPGTYAYLVRVDGLEVDPPASASTQWYEGKELWSVQSPACEIPRWNAQRIEADGPTLRATLEFQAGSASKALLDPTTLRVTAGAVELGAESLQIDVASGQVQVVYTAPTPGKYSIRVYGKDVEGVDAENSGLWLPVWSELAEPFTWQDGLIYLAFTDRFRNSDEVAPPLPDPSLDRMASYQGGDFGGVLAAIESDYFDDLGVNILWLSPTYENPAEAYGGRDGSLYTGYHGYWPIDPLAAESSFGGDEALLKVVEAAHARGMRIIFDIVLNHVHEDHVYCQESPDWCSLTCVCGTQDCDWEGPNGRALDCQFAPYLPDLNYRNPAIVDRVITDVLALMEKFDVDGLRIDAAKHMDHVVMRTLRQRLDTLEEAGVAPFYLVGETFTNDHGLIMEYVSDDELHGQFDFPLYYGIRGAFNGGGSFRDLDAAAAASQRSYGTALEWMSPFLGNHDIARMATEIAGNGQGPFGDTPDSMAQGPSDTITEWNIINRMSMAFLFTLTQPGVPLIYYGDEVGLAGDGDPDNRRFMPQTLNANQIELFNRVKQIGQLRKKIPVLRHGTRKELWLDDSLYAYVRAGESGDAAIIAMNKGETARSESITIPSALGLAGKTLSGANNPDKSVIVIDGKIQLQLNPWEYLILVPE